jgi:hypothetical protein
MEEQKKTFSISRFLPKDISDAERAEKKKREDVRAKAKRKHEKSMMKMQMQMMQF